MSTIKIGNLSAIRSTTELVSKLVDLADGLKSVLEVSQLKSTDGLSEHLSTLDKKISQAKNSINHEMPEAKKEFLLTFRHKQNVGSDLLDSVIVDSEWLQKNEFLANEHLKKIAINSDILQCRDFLVQFNHFTFDDLFKTMKDDVVHIAGNDIFVRAKYVIKPAQPGMEKLNEWSPLSDSVSLVVVKLKDDVEALTFQHLKKVLAENPHFTLDSQENIFLKS